MSGGGNDFVLFDNRKKVLPADYSALAKKVCHRKFSIGADGLLVLEDEPTADFRMVYFNADGSRAEMCGNGARCIARFAHILKATPSKMKFQTDAGLITGEVSENSVKVNLGTPKDMRLDFSIKLEEQKELNISSINTGVPHTVVLVTDIEKITVPELGKKIRYLKEFSPAGTNVNFVQHVDETHLIVRTYERGVENETLACGTGVTASAIICGVKKLVTSPVDCLTHGGETLRVYFHIEEAGQRRAVTDVFLEGPATVSFHGEVEI
ncbi:MAG: diaminopimelate epimerase [Elusimicrobia bacterium RIFCSPLOWO2_01_FULL_54_10]|nr:MAG: diaminopimelate epimerase [Elusimicrobia bacterium RIFCSPLOWO2_01_FULL_54_10]